MNKKHTYRRRSLLTRQIVLHYFLALILFIFLFIGFTFTCMQFFRQFTWQPDNPFYQILSFIKEWILLFAGLPAISGVILITFYYMSKPLRYLDDIIDASGRLVASTETPVELPPAIKNIEDELNLFREQALRSELLAKEAEQRKNDLIVYLAHDLKTPLTSVIGYLTLLRDEPQISAPVRARYTGIALEKALRLEELIEEFFDITRFNLTALSFEPERTNLSRMLEQIAYEFNPLMAEKNLTWQIDLAQDVEILCDRDKLQRVFDNLIRNAVNYAYSGTELTLSMEKLDEGVTVLVGNHGRTIPPEKLNRLFDRFFRLDPSRSSSTGGSGLGLAISKELVDLHGGRIQAKSSEGRITFTVFLPDTQS